MPEQRVSEPTELIFPPQPSWAPLFVALGLAVLLIGIFKTWVIAVIGAIVLLAALRTWIRDTGGGVSRLPREQRVTSAVIPAAPLRETRPRR